MMLSSLLLVSHISVAKNAPLSEAGFADYVVELKAEALTKGFSQALIDSSFSQIKFHKRAVKADRSQPENVETLDTYLPKRVPKWKVDKARALYKKHQALLADIGEKYSVQPRFYCCFMGVRNQFW